MVLGTRVRTQGIAHTGQALANAPPSVTEIPGPVITYMLHPDTRVLFPRPPRPRKATASLLTDRETKDPEAERLSQGHSLNPKPDQPSLPTKSHSAVPAPGVTGGACAITREPVLRPAARSRRGRGTEPRAWPVTARARVRPPARPALTRRGLPGKPAPPKHRPARPRRSRRLREPRTVPGADAARKYSSRK